MSKFNQRVYNLEDFRADSDDNMLGLAHKIDIPEEGKRYFENADNGLIDYEIDISLSKEKVYYLKATLDYKTKFKEEESKIKIYNSTLEIQSTNNLSLPRYVTDAMQVDVIQEQEKLQMEDFDDQAPGKTVLVYLAKNNAQDEEKYRANMQFVGAFWVPYVNKEDQKNEPTPMVMESEDDNLEVLLQTMLIPQDDYDKIIFKLQRDRGDYQLAAENKFAILQTKDQALCELTNLIASGCTIEKLGVQGPTNLRFCINKDQIKMGWSGIYEIQYDGYQIKRLYIAPYELQKLADKYVIVDYLYHGNDEEQKASQSDVPVQSDDEITDV